MNKILKKYSGIFLAMLIVSLVNTVKFGFTKNELMGKINPSRDTNFVKVSAEFTDRAGLYLRKEAYESFIKMHQAALKDKVNLRIVSAFRSFYHQKSIWEAKWTGKRKVDGEDLSKTSKGDFYKAKTILMYSSMPGSSRHHWGTDVDLNNLENEYFEGGEGKRIYYWLTNHASEFGFYQVYSVGRTVGYQEEKWHWSYLPLAKEMLKEYKEQVSYTDFNGFLGSEQADSVLIIDNFVLGINDECKK